jgi:hypothetical protein
MNKILLDIIQSYPPYRKYQPLMAAELAGIILEFMETCANIPANKADIDFIQWFKERNIENINK